MAYTSEHLSLAALELFIHIDDEEEPRDLVAVEAELALDPKTVEEQKRSILKRLGPNWRYEVSLTRDLGDTWFATEESLVMPVPSVVIEVEWNLLINPGHAEFARMKIVQQRPFRFDERMFKR
jgi:RES domain-containing protein